MDEEQNHDRHQPPEQSKGQQPGSQSQGEDWQDQPEQRPGWVVGLLTVIVIIAVGLIALAIWQTTEKESPDEGSEVRDVPEEEAENDIPELSEEERQILENMDPDAESPPLSDEERQILEAADPDAEPPLSDEERRLLE